MFCRFQGEPKSGTLTEKEAKILARLNARKANKPTQEAKVEEFLPDKNAAYPVDASPPKQENVEKKPGKKKLQETLDLNGSNLNEEGGTKKKKKKKNKEDSPDTAKELNGVPENETQYQIMKNNSLEEAVSAMELGEMPSAFSEPVTKKKKPRKNKQEIADEAEKGGDTELMLDEDATAEQTSEDANEEEATGAGFTVLEEVKADKHQKVFRVLPSWLAKPSVISCDLSGNKMPVKEMKGLDKFLLEALRRNKINHFFPGNSLSCFSQVIFSFLSCPFSTTTNHPMAA